MTVDMDLMHGTNAIQRDAWNTAAHLPWEASVEFMIEMVVKDNPKFITRPP